MLTTSGRFETRRRRRLGLCLLVWSALAAGCAAAEEEAPVTAEAPPPAVDRSPAGSTSIRASRLFATADEYPPHTFAAYGIVAFRSVATSATRDRYVAICEGFVAALPAAEALLDRGVPLSDQMGTVWPLNDAELAARANQDSYRGDAAICQEVVDDIDLTTSLDAIDAARAAAPTDGLTGEGPFLLAWSPSTSIGAADVLVLVMDLSDVINVDQATRLFGDWAVEIEQDPEVWNGGWSIQVLVRKVSLLADRYGADIVRALGMDGGR